MDKKMDIQEFIDKFHYDFWLNSNDLPYMSFRFSYFNKRNDNQYDREKTNFDPFYQISEVEVHNLPVEWGVFREINDRVISEHMLNNFNLIIDKYIGCSKQLTKKLEISN